MAFLTLEMSRLLHAPDIGFSRVHISTLLTVFALLRPAWLLALLDRSDLETVLQPPRTFYPSFLAERSPSPRVEYCYTAPGRTP
jgi:hypothetical protein